MNWIKCSERLPNEENFLATDGNIMFVCQYKDEFERYIIGGWESCIYCGGTSLASFIVDGFTVKKITHWMPLPKMPEI